MAVSELIEERLTGYEGLIRAMALARKPSRRIPIAVDEWNVWYRTHSKYGGIPAENKLEETYNLEDGSLNLNALRHAESVKMANLAQIVNGLSNIYQLLWLSDNFFLNP
jgi:alpha-N-arabinofuranosidase